VVYGAASVVKRNFKSGQHASTRCLKEAWGRWVARESANNIYAGGLGGTHYKVYLQSKSNMSCLHARLKYLKSGGEKIFKASKDHPLACNGILEEGKMTLGEVNNQRRGTLSGRRERIGRGCLSEMIGKAREVERRGLLCAVGNNDCKIQIGGRGIGYPTCFNPWGGQRRIKERGGWRLLVDQQYRVDTAW